MRAALAALALILLVAPAAAADTGPGSGVADEPAAAAAPEPAPPPLRIGIAPFEGVAGPDVLLPDLAAFLAVRLARVEGVEVVDPRDLGAPALLEPEADAVKRWAEDAGLDAIVVGRTTRASQAVSLDLRLRAGSSGEIIESWFREMPSLDEAPATLDPLVPELVADATALRDAPPAEDASEPPSRFGLSVDSGEPLSIQSDELEAFQNDGARRLVFRKNVVVEQDDVRITANLLEAFYPAGSKKPDRLVATGDVVMAQGKREARCDEATYERAEQTLVCRGNAELHDGPDSVAGEEIAFDLETEAVRVSGRAAVVFHPGPDGGSDDEVPN